MERIGAELAAIQRIALDADQPEAAPALLRAFHRTLGEQKPYRVPRVNRQLPRQAAEHH